MKKIHPIFAAIFGIALSATLTQAQTPAVPMAALQKISEHVYAHVDTHNATTANSYGANAGVIIGRDGVLVVDTLISAQEAEKFLAEIKKVTDKPIKYVVNTHYHLDHAWGNCVFTKAGATVIAQDHAREDQEKGAAQLASPEQWGLTKEQLKGTTLVGPSLSFSDTMTVDLGDVQVELKYWGYTHTDDSLTVLVAKEGVLFTGDALFTGYHPYLAEGNLANWTAKLEELSKLPVTKIIPGHGPVSTTKDLLDMKVYLETFDKVATKLCAGKKAEDAPLLAAELLKQLPEQNRKELPGMVAGNLQMKYLPQPASK